MNRRLHLSALVALLAAFSAAGCSRIQSRAAFKNGNKEYREENFKKAARWRAIARWPTRFAGPSILPGSRWSRSWSCAPVLRPNGTA